MWIKNMEILIISKRLIICILLVIFLLTEVFPISTYAESYTDNDKLIFFKALSCDDAEIAKSMLEKFPSLINELKDESPRNGAVGLMYARGLNTTKLLYSYGFDVNQINSGGLTPLHYVNSADVAEFLIAKGANINAKDYLNGTTPLQIAATQGEFDIVKVLVSHGANLDGALFNAEVRNHYEIVEYLRCHEATEPLYNKSSEGIGLIPDSQCRLLTENDLKGLSAWELNIARNEIFARYGRPFNTQVYRDYFSSQSWYEENSNYQDSLLSDIEKSNAIFIKNYQDKTGFK